MPIALRCISHYYNFGNGSILMMSGRKTGTNLKHRPTDRFLSMLYGNAAHKWFNDIFIFWNMIKNTMCIPIHIQC